MLIPSLKGQADLSREMRRAWTDGRPYLDVFFGIQTDA